MTDPDVKRRIRIATDDIALLGFDAIVNSANASLLGGGAIHRAAGTTRASRGMPKARRLPTWRGSAHPRIPPAGWLRHPHCRPDLAGRDCRRRSDTGSLLPFEPGDSLALRFRDIAFTTIATGIYGYPRDAAARVALAAACSISASSFGPIW
jgi:O-acetyl-ADP-ribose deacetylase